MCNLMHKCDCSVVEIRDLFNVFKGIERIRVKKGNDVIIVHPLLKLTL